MSSSRIEKRYSNSEQIAAEHLERTDKLFKVIEEILAPGKVPHEFQRGVLDCVLCGEGVAYYLHVKHYMCERCCQDFLDPAELAIHDRTCPYVCGLCGCRVWGAQNFTQHTWQCSR